MHTISSVPLIMTSARLPLFICKKQLIVEQLKKLNEKAGTKLSQTVPALCVKETIQLVQVLDQSPTSFISGDVTCQPEYLPSSPFYFSSCWGCPVPLDVLLEQIRIARQHWGCTNEQSAARWGASKHLLSYKQLHMKVLNGSAECFKRWYSVRFCRTHGDAKSAHSESVANQIPWTNMLMTAFDSCDT